MEIWIKEAKEGAKERAKWFIEEVFEEADEQQIDKEWYLEECIKNIHLLKNKQIKD